MYNLYNYLISCSQNICMEYSYVMKCSYNLSNNPLTPTENHYTWWNTWLEFEILYKNDFEKYKNNI